MFGVRHYCLSIAVRRDRINSASHFHAQTLQIEGSDSHSTMCLISVLRDHVATGVEQWLQAYLCGVVQQCCLIGQFDRRLVEKPEGLRIKLKKYSRSAN